jgi:hypothetical protein
MQPFPQRSQAGWIGVQKWVVIVERALSYWSGAGRYYCVASGFKDCSKKRPAFAGLFAFCASLPGIACRRRGPSWATGLRLTGCFPVALGGLVHRGRADQYVGRCQIYFRGVFFKLLKK